MRKISNQTSKKNARMLNQKWCIHSIWMLVFLENKVLESLAFSLYPFSFLFFLWKRDYCSDLPIQLELTILNMLLFFSPGWFWWTSGLWQSWHLVPYWYSKLGTIMCTSQKTWGLHESDSVSKLDCLKDWYLVWIVYELYPHKAETPAYCILFMFMWFGSVLLLEVSNQSFATELSTLREEDTANDR